MNESQMPEYRIRDYSEYWLNIPPTLEYYNPETYGRYIRIQEVSYDIRTYITNADRVEYRIAGEEK